MSTQRRKDEHIADVAVPNSETVFEGYGHSHGTWRNSLVCSWCFSYYGTGEPVKYGHSLHDALPNTLSTFQGGSRERVLEEPSAPPTMHGRTDRQRFWAEVVNESLVQVVYCLLTGSTCYVSFRSTQFRTSTH